MNGNLYSGGYAKGNFAFVGVTDGADVNPVPSATLWGDTTSDVQAHLSTLNPLPLAEPVPDRLAPQGILVPAALQLPLGGSDLAHHRPPPSEPAPSHG